MLSYWNNKSAPTPTPSSLLKNTHEVLYFYFLHFIENKCLSDLICDVKREKNEFVKRWIRTQVDRVKKSLLHA